MINRTTAEDLEKAKAGCGIAACRFASRFIRPKDNPELYVKIYNIYFNYFKQNLTASPETT